MSEPRVVYVTDEVAGEEIAVVADSNDALPAQLLDYLRERRRALITELRRIEEMLNIPQSIPARRRPH